MKQAEAMNGSKDNSACFVCGRSNASGLRAEFLFDETERTLRGRFTPRTEHQGYEGIVHGGVIAALLDEAMVKLSGRTGAPAVSAELAVRFRAPAAPGESLAVLARITAEAGRLVEAEARVERGSTVIAEARGKMLRGKER